MGTAKPVSAFILAAALFTALPKPSSAAFRFFDPTDTTQVPALISASGFYDNMTTKQVTTGAVPFEVNSALWSDAAAKKRWVILKPGTRILYNDTSDYYGYPDGAVFVKQFAIDTVPGDTTTRILWETRFLVLKKDTVNHRDNWHGFSYRWNRQGTDAKLVNMLMGERGAVRYFPNGRGQPAQLKKWAFPSQGKCNECHINRFDDTKPQPRGVLGFFTAQLNRPDAPGEINQIKRLFNVGVFEGVQPQSFTNSPRWYGLNDASPAATLELKARSYLASNCSGCHGDRGIANNTLGHRCKVNFDFYDMKKPDTLGIQRVGALEYQKTTNGNPDTKENNYIVRPEHPEFSSIIWRLEAKNEDVPVADTTEWEVDVAFDIVPVAIMPPLGRYQVDTAASTVLKAWINSLKDTMPIVSVFHQGIRNSAAMPRVAGGQIFLEGVRNLPAKAWLVDTRGKRLALPATGPGRYRLPARMAPGVYSLMLDEGRAYRILLP